MIELRSRPLMRVEIALHPPLEIGATPLGRRRVVNVAGGTFAGERLRGRILDGADWLLLRGDGCFQQDVRMTLETDDGALIYMTSFGLRHGPPEVLAALARGESVDPSKYYFRTAPRFETSASQYAFLNRLIAISSGDRRPSGPIYTIEEIL